MKSICKSNNSTKNNNNLNNINNNLHLATTNNLTATNDLTTTNDSILLKFNSQKNTLKLKIITKLKNIVPSINDNDLIKLYDTSISLHQCNLQNNGNFLENDILVNLFNNNKINYKQQVTIDKNGIIIGFNIKKKCYHIIDFVIGNEIEIGKSILLFCVISCKTTCRERWTQDNWSFTICPLKFILLTMSNDYPKSIRFRESNCRKIITCISKKKDDRIYKLNFNNLIDEIKIL